MGSKTAMNSTASPYREMGINAWAKTKVVRLKQPRGFSPLPDAIKWRHDFGYLTAMSADRSRIATCSKCGGPRFAVESFHCLGGRKIWR